MIMKQYSSLLRAIGLSAGLVASAAMMPSVHAATSGTITATGTIPATCSVNGGSITMTQDSPLQLSGDSSSLPISSTGTSTTFSLTTPVVTKPQGSTVNEAILSGTITIPGKSDQIITSDLVNSGSSTISNPLSGGVVFRAILANSAADLTPGTYGLASTLTCVTN